VAAREPMADPAAHRWALRAGSDSAIMSANVFQERDSMSRDIDYAAVAVNRAIVEKFGRSNDLQSLKVTALENTIEVCDGDRMAVGTRDSLLANLRRAEAYADLW
jgi:hypothetical protein